MTQALLQAFLCTFTAHAGSRLSHKPEFCAHGPEFFRRWPWVFFSFDLSFFPCWPEFFLITYRIIFTALLQMSETKSKISCFFVLGDFWFRREKRLHSGTCFFRPEFTELEIYETLSFRWKYLSFFATLSFFRTWVFLKMHKKKPVVRTVPTVTLWNAPEKNEFCIMGEGGGGKG